MRSLWMLTIVFLFSAIPGCCCCCSNSCDPLAASSDALAESYCKCADWLQTRTCVHRQRMCRRTSAFLDALSPECCCDACCATSAYLDSCTGATPGCVVPPPTYPVPNQSYAIPPIYAIPPSAYRTDEYQHTTPPPPVPADDAEEGATASAAPFQGGFSGGVTQSGWASVGQSSPQMPPTSR